jgi:opacity protein-like surface antigen
MKKVIATAALLASLLYGENIDGTLAVDSYNSGSSCSTDVPRGGQQAKTPNRLSAKMDESYSSKGEEGAYSKPASASTPTLIEGPFVGVEVGPVFGADADGLNIGGLSYGLRFGAQNVEWRTMAILESFGNSDEVNEYLRGLLQLDYFFLGMDNVMVDTFALRPYFGLSLGAISMDTQYQNIKSITYGAQVGATVNLSTNLDLDVGYRYNLATSEDIDKVHGLSVGLHYKY